MYPVAVRRRCGKGSGSLRSGAAHSVAESALGDAALAVRGRDPGLQQGGAHARVLADQCGLRFVFLEGEGFTLEKMAPSCRLQVRQAPRRGKGCSPSSLRPEAAQLGLAPVCP